MISNGLLLLQRERRTLHCRLERTSICSAVLVMLLAIGSNAPAAVLIEMDLEDDPQLPGGVFINPGAGSNGQLWDDGEFMSSAFRNGTGQQQSLSSAISYGPGSSWRSQVLGGNGSAGPSDRSEYIVDQAADIFDQFHYFSFAAYLPNDFSPPTDWFLMSQWFQFGNNNVHPPLSINVIDGGGGMSDYQIVTRYNVGDTWVNRQQGELNFGWNHFAMAVKFSKTGDGQLTVWKDGSEVLDYFGILGMTSQPGGAPSIGWDTKPKLGIYRGDSPLEHNMYFDDIVYATSFSDIFGEITNAQAFFAPDPADFNGDGIVDHADLVKWEGDFGVSDGSDADADADGDSDGADFLQWQRALDSGVESLSTMSHVVPEPHSGMAALVLVGLMMTPGNRFMSRQRGS